MYIWRVENNKGEGCYKSERTRKSLSHHINSKHHPTPNRDEKIYRHPKIKEICGFKYLLQALRWFSNKDLSILEEYGYYLKKINVKKITVYGDKQVLAIR